MFVGKVEASKTYPFKRLMKPVRGFQARVTDRPDYGEEINCSVSCLLQLLSKKLARLRTSNGSTISRHHLIDIDRHRELISAFAKRVEMTTLPQGSLQLYELVGKSEELRISPWAWSVRFALFHKGLAFQSIPWRRVEKDKIAFTGQGKIPVLLDGDKHVVDSWEIMKYLEEKYPDRPALFGPAGSQEALTFFTRQWLVDLKRGPLPPLFAMIAEDVRDLNHSMDQAYWRKNREALIGTTIEEFAKQGSLDRARAAFEPVRTVLADYKFLGGSAPCAADYMVMGALMWARVCSSKHQQIFEENDPLNRWSECMMDLFDGMARGQQTAAALL